MAERYQFSCAPLPLPEYKALQALKTMLGTTQRNSLCVALRAVGRLIQAPGGVAEVRRLYHEFQSQAPSETLPLIPVVVDPPAQPEPERPAATSLTIHLRQRHWVNAIPYGPGDVEVPAELVYHLQVADRQATG